MKCPICQKKVKPGGGWVPFCSDRCRLIDLGNWASEKYRIPAPLEPSAADQGEPEQHEQPDRGQGQ